VGKLLLALAVAALLFVLAVALASEYGGEVVHLYTQDHEGAERETSLWIVEDDGRLYLRAGNPSSGWLARLREHPEVEMERAGRRQRYRAVIAEEQRARVSHLMAEKYGWADWLIGLTRDEGGSVPVRLEPLRS
jgi:hypothetical protein